MNMRKKLWIQDALKGHKPGSLHRQLGVPMDKKIPKSLLNRIKASKVGKKYGRLKAKIRNPTKTGKKTITVTPLLKKRAVLAHTLRGFK